jgi:hypothetical protein
LVERKGTVRLPGGDLTIEGRALADPVLMTGPVEHEGLFRRPIIRRHDAVNAGDDGVGERSGHVDVVAGRRDTSATVRSAEP